VEGGRQGKIASKAKSLDQRPGCRIENETGVWRRKEGEDGWTEPGSTPVIEGENLLN